MAQVPVNIRGNLGPSTHMDDFATSQELKPVFDRMRNNMGNAAIIIPFSLPVTLLTVGWKAVAQRKNQGPADWRSPFIWLALFFATVATFTAMAFWFSWNGSGGSPHGMMPGPGLWVRLRAVWELSVVATVAMGGFAALREEKEDY